MNDSVDEAVGTTASSTSLGREKLSADGRASSVPAGRMNFGEGETEIVIEHPYSISRNLVTVAQLWNIRFMAVVDVEGYEQDRFWTADGSAWRNGKAELKNLPDWYRTQCWRKNFPISRPED